CHMFTKIFDSPYGHKNWWFAETLCELSSLWCLGQMGEDWLAGGSPYPHLNYYGKHLKEYLDYHIQDTQRFGAVGEFSAWFEAQIPVISANGVMRDINTVIAVQLLPLFVEEPGIFEAFPWLNDGLDPEADFRAHLLQWRAAVPENLKPHIAKIAAGLGVSLDGEADKIRVKPKLHPVKITQDEWGEGTPVSSVEPVIVSVTETFLKHGNVAADGPIFVKQHPTMSNPGAGKDEHGNRKIDLATEGTRWAQLVYQFAHEYCHQLVMSDFHEPFGTSANGWFDETLCELASLWALNRMSEDWLAGGAPFERWNYYGVHFKEYLDNHIAGTRTFGSPEEFAAWLHTELPDLRKHKELRDRNTTVAVQLLPLFIEKPQLWEVMPYFSVGMDVNATLRDFLRGWQRAVPEHMKQHIAEIANRLGYPLDGDDSKDRDFPPEPHPVKVDQPEWGSAWLDNVEAVCNSVALTFAKYGNAIADTPILLRQGPDIATKAELEPGGERLITLTSTDTYWSQLAFQFAGEYSRVLSKDWLLPSDHKNRWFTDALREASVFWVMDKMGDDWLAGKAPFTNWRDYGVHHKNHVADHFAGVQTFDNRVEFMTWFEENEASPDSRVVAAYLLPVFKDHPERWEALMYLNANQKTDSGLNSFMLQWRENVPDNLKHFVMSVFTRLAMALD
ncbi:MAG: hypothetical protein FWG05_01715, partial [Kiritimatiellaeota bacterium]|nr:hypothetical protein [Kiritimatiellota bacterium]